eukprot:CAMPEP_0171133212 /NCGR_PEP_ID=MMETSP0766_2-20121228/125905_1 /TAXON_ID=439317 /ORGANISM="Gambierdiscus australes, Strain CAWD 149" /LENGTH=78 /DNA_ID=CAMNT_0011596581 /DNA_START=396 /DNA_END=629 /DNA_ORIENTATION=-
MEARSADAYPPNEPLPFFKKNVFARIRELLKPLTKNRQPLPDQLKLPRGKLLAITAVTPNPLKPAPRRGLAEPDAGAV